VTLCESPIDLGPHDLAVSRWMVVAAEQRTSEIFPGLMQCGDLVVEGSESTSGNGLPFASIRGVKDSGDISQGEPCILEHADEYEPSECCDAVAALPGRSSIGDE
jgi:hypothetical protein